MTTASKYAIWSRATRNNPHPLYEQMRRDDPIYRVIDGLNHVVWFFTNYEDTVAVLKDKRFIKNGRKNLPPEIRKQYYNETVDPMWAPIEFHMLNQDPPDHTRLRALVHKAFTPRRVRDLEPRIRDIAQELLDAMAQKEEGDLIADFAFPLPITVIAEMLGIPGEDREKFRDWTQTILTGRGGASVMEFAQYMNAQIEQRRQNETDDILSALIRAEEDGDKLDHMELLSMIFLLLVAGHETTVNLIGNGLLALMQHPDQFALLRDDPNLIDSAIEEFLRYDGPVDATTLRFAGEDIDWKGHQIQAGDIVHPLLLAANRDPDVFEHPHKLDITRDPNPHLAFGQGIHYCVGAPLARMEGRIAITMLLEKHPNLQLNADPSTLQRNGLLLINGLQELPVRY